MCGVGAERIIVTDIETGEATKERIVRTDSSNPSKQRASVVRFGSNLKEIPQRWRGNVAYNDSPRRDDIHCQAVTSKSSRSG